MMRVGLNGFGRIGRAILRANSIRPRCRIVLINDLDPDIGNHAYLLKHDSLYGRFPGAVEIDEGRAALVVDGESIGFHHLGQLGDVPWKEGAAIAVVDATGVEESVSAARYLTQANEVRHVLFAFAPRSEVDVTIIHGVNQSEFDRQAHRLISTATCDANAVGPIINVLDKAIGLVHASVTTLHPWLMYQNLLDGSTRSVSSPTHYWEDFALGRASTLSLIPKDTTLVEVLGRVLPETAARMHAVSFRVPTPLVSAADMTLVLQSLATRDDVLAVLKRAADLYPSVIHLTQEPLVSIDIRGMPHSVVMEERWIQLQGDHILKLIAWYDNEWAYAERVLDTLALLDSTIGSP